jgi:Zn finger protein HypA/HybF involved in hydrogenase expression
MHTVAEFRSATRRYTLRSLVWVLVVLVVAPAVSCGPVALFGWLTAPPGVAPGQVAPDWVYLSSTVVFLVLLFGGLILLDRRLKRPAELRCPHCEHALVEAAAVVIATRHCPRCGRRVLAEPDEQSPPTRTAAELAAAADQAVTASNKMIWPTVLTFLGPLVILAPAVLFRDTLREWLRPLADQDTVVTVVMAIVIMPMLAGGVWIVLVGRRTERATGRCPHCNGRVQSRLSAVTGNCGMCGGRVATLPQDPPDGPLVPVDVVVQTGRMFRRGLWLRCGIGGAVGIGLMIIAGVILGGGRREKIVADLEQRFGVVEAAVIEVVGVSGIVIAVVGSIFGGIWLGIRKMTVPAGCRCPHCAATIGGIGLTAASKRCTGCRRRVVAEPVEESRSGELLGP